MAQGHQIVRQPPLKNGIPISFLLVIPFVLQIFAVVGITGYLSFRNGQKVVKELVTQLQEEATDRVELHLDNYLATATELTKINVDAIELELVDLHDLETAGRFFWKQLQIFKDVKYISYLLETGEFIGVGLWPKDGKIYIDEISAKTNWKNHSYLADEQGNRAEFDEATDYDPKSESWYAETIKAGKLNWSKIYPWDEYPGVFSVAISHPIYDSEQNLVTIFGVDLILTEISNFLANIDISPSSKVFIIERDGLIVASSSSEKPYQMVDEEAQRLNVLQSSDSLIKKIAQYLSQHFGDFDRINSTQQLNFDIDGDRYFTRITPWQDELGLDWLVVVAMPESDFMKEINAHNRTTILLCLASLLVATGLGIITSHWITSPIRRLSNATKAIAEINDILDLAKIEARKLELYLTDIHLARFLSGVAGIIKMRALEKDILFQYEASLALPTGIQADEKRLRQVLLNLLGNAVKFTDYGTVTLQVISLEQEQSENGSLKQTLRFEVQDTGVGMNPQQLAKIFQPFEQVGDVKRRGAGTGLGLTISRQLVELMGGQLQVSSELGRGSTFWFEATFPVVEEVKAQDTLTEQRRIVGYQGERRQILVVDDKQENRLVLQNMLEPLGFEITLGEDGQQEIELARQIQPDCILTDLVMPVKTGFEAVKAIRNLPELKEVIIIAISASVLDMDREKSKMFGCNSFLPKPVEETKLLALLQEYLQLDWIYEEVEEEDASHLVTTELSTNQTLVAPPPEELEILYELAMLGSMKQIRERAIYLEELDEQYGPLAAKLKDLAGGFQEKAIVNLIEQYLV